MPDPEVPMSDDDTEAVAGLDADLGKRFLVVAIHDDGSLSCDPEDVAPYELPGIAMFIEDLGRDLMDINDEE